MKVVVSLNHRPGEALPTERQVRLALGAATQEAMALLAKWDHAAWMTVVKEIKVK